MGQPVVHFEIIGNDPAKLRSYYGDLFGWEFDTTVPVAEAVSEAGNYGFVIPPGDGVGIPGGVGGGAGYDGHVVFYVGVPDIEAALQKAESLGGTRRMGPARAPVGAIAVGHFTDPEGHLIGVASAACSRHARPEALEAETGCTSRRLSCYSGRSDACGGIGARSLTKPGCASMRSSHAATFAYSRGSAPASLAQCTYAKSAMSAMV